MLSSRIGAALLCGGLIAALALGSSGIPLSSFESADGASNRVALSGAVLESGPDTTASVGVADDHPVSLRLLLPEDAAEDVVPHTIASWLRAAGLRFEPGTSAAGTLPVSGDAAGFERAFGTPLVRVDHRGSQIVHPRTTPSIPRALAEDIRGVAGSVQADHYQPLNTGAHEQPDDEAESTATDLLPTPEPRSPDAESRRSPSSAAGTPRTSDACSRYWGERLTASWPANAAYELRSNWLCGYAPRDLRIIHGVPDSITGTGARIGIIAAYDDPAVEANTNEYFTTAGAQPLRPGQYVVHAPDDPDESVCGGVANWTDEQHLDVQAAHAIAPDARIVYWGANSCRSLDLFSTILEAAGSQTVDVLSLSFGSREKSDTADDRELLNRALVQAAANGVSVFAASGNDGDYTHEGDHPELDVTSPASSPYVTAVGGVSAGLRRDGSLAVMTGWASKPFFARTGGLIPPGFDSGSGGGSSSSYRAPSWQDAASGLDSGSSYRHTPDVAALADPTSGFTVYTTTGEGTAYRSIGGTSLATPIVASMVSMAKAEKGLRIGLATPWLYRLQGTAAIRDIRHQDAAVWSNLPSRRGQLWPETIYAWDASPQSLRTGVGWDEVTGLGVPRGAAFFELFGETQR
ncbi:S8 family serine peptidase [Leucobacter weissii]|uniref:S8 family serine peptidase n=1 Tax=Leucobacter weissii TaxID=1983706 RepID=A0A939MNQ0_9MICO|nr:S8 family serine peptidase [Leucobacter weissii]